MYKAIWVIVISVLITGCATPMVWDKPGATQQDFNKDNYECEKDARQSGYYGRGIAGALEMQAFFKRCMVAKGYTLRQQTDSNYAIDLSTDITPPSMSIVKSNLGFEVYSSTGLIKAVTENSPASRAGMTIRGVINKINGKDKSQVPIADLDSLLSPSSGKSLNLEIKEGTQVKTIMIYAP